VRLLIGGDRWDADKEEDWRGGDGMPGLSEGVLGAMSRGEAVVDAVGDSGVVDAATGGGAADGDIVEGCWRRNRLL